jgi:D-3-phosphoglycerate dehydrogenase
MKIAICDDYQDTVHQLPAFRMLDGHEVVRFREPARDEDALLQRLHDVNIIVAVRERVEFRRSLLERLPKLKLIALVGRNVTTIDFDSCTALGIPVSTGKSYPTADVRILQEHDRLSIIMKDGAFHRRQAALVH